MGVSDARRLEVYEQARAQWGDGPAETLMEMVVPAGQDMATRQDVEASTVLTRNELIATRTKLEVSIEKVRNDFEVSIAKLRNDLEVSIEKVRNDLEASIEKVRNDLEASIAKLRSDMGIRFARLEERVSGLASKEYVLRVVIVSLVPVYGMLIGVLFGIYGR